MEPLVELWLNPDVIAIEPPVIGSASLAEAPRALPADIVTAAPLPLNPVPTASEIAPVPPEWDVPVLSETKPLSARPAPAPAFAVTKEIEPLEVNSLRPVLRTIEPPPLFTGDASSVESWFPACRVMPPAVPLYPSPTVTLIDPELPEAACPVLNEIEPLLPSTALEPAAVLIDTAPLE
jgi:hypothetical protein